MVLEEVAGVKWAEFTNYESKMHIKIGEPHVFFNVLLNRDIIIYLIQLSENGRQCEKIDAPRKIFAESMET